MTIISFHSRRSPVYSQNGIVATSQPFATAAGAAVMSPSRPPLGSAEICSRCFIRQKPGRSLPGMDRAALTLDRLKKDGFSTELPPFHVHTVTVPGACAGWLDLIEKHGSLYTVGGFERSLLGRGQVILRDAETGMLVAGSDGSTQRL